jgi:hypothetical protein
MPLAGRVTARQPVAMRTFIYRFNPENANPAPGPTIALSTEQIEDARIKEVLQTPGAALGIWSLL